MGAWAAALASGVVLAAACGTPSAASTSVPASPSSTPSTSTGSGTGTTPTTTGPHPSAATAATDAASACVERTLATLSPAARAGQVLLVGVPATDPLPDAARLAALHVGGI